MANKKMKYILFERHMYLAKIYARKLYQTEKISLEIKDIEQELCTKIYTSIISYGRKWGEYKKTGRYKPVALKHYLKLSLNNKLIDFVKKIQKSPHKTTISTNSKEDGIDIGIESNSNRLNLDKMDFVIGGVDILHGLKPMEKSCYVLYLKGFKPKKLEKIYKKHFSASELIEAKKTQLLKKKDFLFESVKRQSFVVNVVNN